MRVSNTSYTERANLTLQTGSRRFKRLTDAFQRDRELHAFIGESHDALRIPSAFIRHFRCKTAIAAKVTAKPWELADIVWVLEE